MHLSCLGLTSHPHFTIDLYTCPQTLFSISAIIFIVRLVHIRFDILMTVNNCPNPTLDNITRTGECLISLGNVYL